VTSCRQDDDFSPIGWIGRIPVYATTLFMGLHASLMVVETLSVASLQGQGNWVEVLIFSSASFFRGGLWRAATYPFVHVLGGVWSFLWFAVELYLLYAFGREVERYIGRRAFFGLYALLTLVPVALFALFGLFVGPVRFSGSSLIHFGIFVAFASLYPGVHLLLQIQAKWAAWILGGILALSALANRDLLGFSHVALIAGVAWGAIAQLRAGGLGAWVETLVARAGSDAPQKTRPGKGRSPKGPEPDALEAIDPLLEKIAKTGMNSLTRNERERLEQARRTLLRRK
jgi:hypothetical protein